MDLEIQITGREDRVGPWKVAIAGYPGSAKTMLASTCEPGQNLFVWFPDSPIKSVANRFLPHVRLGNQLNTDGSLRSGVQDQLHVLIANLQMQAMMGGEEQKYTALTIDTGNQLFQQMASARRAKNRGEFGPGDWTWLADAYRTVMQALIDLPMHVIVLFHMTSTQDGQDGFMVRELALQGSSKAEAPSWFDVVGALDTFETVDENGDTTVQRVLLTHSSRMYPWVKDHSGNMPSRFPISDNFVGDWDRMMKIFVGHEDWQEGQDRQVIDHMSTERPVANSGAPVPTPAELRAKKLETPHSVDTIKASEPIIPEQPAATPEVATIQEDEAPEVKVEQAALPLEEETIVNEPEGVDDKSPEPSEEAIIETLAEGGIEAKFVCDVCSEPVDDEDLREVTKIRFPDRVLCRDHFKAALADARKA